ncbi:MAG: hypothetical protein ACLQBQ_09375 [Smithella sp.]
MDRKGKMSMKNNISKERCPNILSLSMAAQIDIGGKNNLPIH